MKTRWKRVLWLTPILCILIVVLSEMVIRKVQEQRDQEPNRDLAQVMQELRTHGLSDQIPALLAQTPKPKGFLADWIVEGPNGNNPMIAPDWNAKILAAYPQNLTGHTRADAPIPKVTADGKRFTQYQTIEIPVTAPDGHRYVISHATAPGEFIGYRIEGLFPWILLLGWIALALGTFLDAREHGSGTAWAWLLLSLVTGPAGLAAWLITRSSMPSRKTSPCPGCGTDTVRGTAFCVRCGHALQPSCPDCRRPVELDWSYCGACGRDLAQ